MSTPAPDLRTARRQEKNEHIASEPILTPLNLPQAAVPSPLEMHLTSRPRPLAVAGVVENGLVRFLDANATLPELSRVIIVASGR